MFNFFLNVGRLVGFDYLESCAQINEKKNNENVEAKCGMWKPRQPVWIVVPDLTIIFITIADQSINPYFQSSGPEMAYVSLACQHVIQLTWVMFCKNTP